SPQMEERGRVLSFERDEPLDMRYSAEAQILNPKSKILNRTAADIVNGSGYDDLERIFREYGEEELSFDIAREIVNRRRDEKIETTKQLVKIILDVYRKKLNTTKEVPWIGGLHPATKVFQALRIVVNDELGVIERALPKAISVLEPGGRLAVITFHSLEDRIVKHYFKDQEGKSINIMTKKPIMPTDDECKQNPRACSAKLRVVEKI
ncbi:MAG: 16S rRNA (cytosine(1402)-N(4))-methyltransferase RsmH, partial [Patescibacteria group bacterium]